MKYNKDQIKAIEYPLMPLMILAGAGTGKTTTIIARIAHLIDKCEIKSDSILLLTFSIEAASNLHNKLIDLVGDKALDVSASTFHSFAYKECLKYYNLLGYDRQPELVNDVDLLILLNSKVDEFPKFKSKLFRRNPIMVIQSLKKIYDNFRQNLFSKLELSKILKKTLVEVEDSQDLLEAEQLFQRIDSLNMFPYYQNWKKHNNIIDYSDMIYDLWNLINKYDHILNDLRNRFKIIIIDEYQDNNYALSQIISKLAHPKNYITVVGDDDQCIYGFRQANVYNMHNFINTYCKKNNPPVLLMKNYRSDQYILEFANKIISMNQDRVDKGILINDSIKQNKPTLFIGDKKDQLWKMINDIKDLLNKNIDLKDITVLARTHSQCLDVSRYLTENGILNNYNANKLFEQPIVKDLVALLHIKSNSKKRIHAFIRLVQSTSVNKTFYDIVSKININDIQISFNKLVDISDLGISDNLRKTIKILDNFNYNNIIDLSDMLFSHLYKSYINEIHFESEKLIINQSIQQFMSFATSYCKKFDSYNLNNFLAYIDMHKGHNEFNLEAIEEFSEINSINILTVHSAKGMEFKHVLIPFLRSGSFPLSFQRKEIIDRIPIEWSRWYDESLSEKEMHYQEEVRLFYVAITRAMETLTLYAPLKSQSVFIKNIDEKILNRIKIKNTSKLDTIYDKLSGYFISKLQIEKQLSNFKLENHLKEVIDNLELLKNNKTVVWNKNLFKHFIIKKISDYKINNVQNIQLSASKIKVFNTCPLKYKYQYIDCIPSFDKSKQMQMGLLIHKVLENFHKNNKITLDELKKLLNIYWDRSFYSCEQENEQNKEDAIMMLENYWNYIDKTQLGMGYYEYEFSFNIDNIELIGKCDRINIDNDNNVTIIDYKTSKNSVSKNILKKDIQLNIYALFLYKHGIQIDSSSKIKVIPKEIIMLYLKKDKPEVLITLNNEDLNKAIDDIKSISSEIKSSSYKPNKGRHCDWCNYKELLCPKFG